MIEHAYDIYDRLQDKVSGFTGICLGITKYDTGCLHYGLCPTKLNDGKMPEWHWFDESRLVLVESEAVSNHGGEPVGGPAPTPPSSSY